jgi:apolipoprotein N-acyltransferase
MAVFSMALTALGEKPVRCMILIPPIWVALEYMRTFIFSGFPWELMGYSQFGQWHLIQISDIFGVYGVSFLILLSNASILFTILFLTKKRWRDSAISKGLMAGSLMALILGLGLTLAYGFWRIKTVEQLMAASPKARITVVQGNIAQGVKWNPAFQIATIKKYNRLSSSAKKDNPDLVVWPESATPFYFSYETKPSKMVMEGILQVNADFLFGSPSFVRTNNIVEYYVSAYLVSPQSKTISRYDKVHLVPYGEYVPLKKRSFGDPDLLRNYFSRAFPGNGQPQRHPADQYHQRCLVRQNQRTLSTFFHDSIQSGGESKGPGESCKYGY